MHNALRLLPLLCAIAAAGCAIGPSPRVPERAVQPAFAEGQGFEAAPVVPGIWRAYQEPELDALIERALRENRSIAQAAARLEESRALRGLTVFGLLPTVTANADRDQSSPSQFDPFLPANQPDTVVYRVGADASWELDFFGAARRAAQAARSDTAALEADLAAARAATVAEVAQAWFALRGAQARRDLQRRTLENLGENLSLLELRVEAGRGTDFDVARARTLVADVAARLPDTVAEVSRQEQRLAVLVAAPLERLRGELLAASRPLPAPPELVAVGTPQDWLRRRPDVRAAERRLASATARIGVEQANFLPRISLLGGFGYTAQDRGDLFAADAQRWRWGPSLSWSFLDVGRVRQRVLASRARERQALAAFDETLLRALEETEGALATYRAANESFAAITMGVEAARRASDIAKLRYDAGASDYLAVLDAERIQLDFEQRVIDTSVARASALALLQRALAGDFASGP
jgi:multidrug efflux system outer membrane protein